MAAPFQRSASELIDCEIHGPGSGAELFVVEGQSAALAVARVRDPRFQAVLPMQGKPLNALRAPARRVAEQPLYRALVAALGGADGQPSDGRPLRFERLLILTDPDADGIHCGVLLLGYIHRHLRPLLGGGAGADAAAGVVEWVRAPWGEVVPEDGSPPCVAHSEAGLLELADRVRGERAARLRRFRGLAAIEPMLLARHCVDPSSRSCDRLDAGRVEGMLAILAEAGLGAGNGAME